MQTDSSSNKWMITGANGNLGKRLIKTILQDHQGKAVAVVRSQRAQDAVHAIELSADEQARLSVVVLDYTDVEALRAAAQGCDKVVHLVGILKATKQATYEEAHERSTAALLKALVDTSVSHLTYMSIVGSSAQASNACLASKGRAEDLCVGDALATCVLRVPMVLGEGDYASFALQKRARSSTNFSFRAASLEQPIYAGDVVQAIIAAGLGDVNARLDLGGPEVLSRRDLTQRAANILGNTSTTISLPIALGLGLAAIMEALLPNPPVTKAMLEVLDHDDNVDAAEALQVLGMQSLTSLDDMLSAVLAGVN